MLLSVDDDPRFLEAAERALDERGGVLFALNAEQARSLLGKVGDDFSVALVDLALPGVDGFSLIREMHRNYPNLPVIAISGVLQPPVLESARMLGGAAEVLRKPVTSEWNAAISRAKTAS